MTPLECSHFLMLDLPHWFPRNSRHQSIKFKNVEIVWNQSPFWRSHVPFFTKRGAWNSDLFPHLQLLCKPRGGVATKAPSCRHGTSSTTQGRGCRDLNKKLGVHCGASRWLATPKRWRSKGATINQYHGSGGSPSTVQVAGRGQHCCDAGKCGPCQDASSRPHSWTRKGLACITLGCSCIATVRLFQVKGGRLIQELSSKESRGLRLELQENEKTNWKPQKFYNLETAVGVTSGSLLKTLADNEGVGFTGKSTLRSLVLSTLAKVVTLSPRWHGGINCCAENLANEMHTVSYCLDSLIGSTFTLLIFHLCRASKIFFKPMDHD